LLSSTHADAVVAAIPVVHRHVGVVIGQAPSGRTDIVVLCSRRQRVTGPWQVRIRVLGTLATTAVGAVLPFAAGVTVQTAMTTAMLITRWSCRTLRNVASNQQNGYAPSSLRVRNRSTWVSSAWHSRLTWLFEMPLVPSALTRSSTRLVLTPCT
jgi:hypothetical protein